MSNDARRCPGCFGTGQRQEQGAWRKCSDCGGLGQIFEPIARGGAKRRALFLVFAVSVVFWYGLFASCKVWSSSQAQQADYIAHPEEHRGEQ